MRIKIKTHEKMVAEFGLDKSNIIRVDVGFTMEMEKAMPNDRIINVKGNMNDSLFLWKSWSISYLMIEEYMNTRYTIYGKKLINLT